MAEAAMILYTFRELAEMMVKEQGIHKGLWGIYVRFSIGAANVPQEDGELLPTALVPVKEIGLQRFDKPSSLTVDAAKVNPDPGAAAKSKATKSRRKRT